MNQWLSFYYPTTAVFIDDEKIFLDALKNRMSSDLSCKTFNNPIEALKAIEDSNPLLYRKIDHPFLLDDQLNESEPDIWGIGLRWDSFTKIIYDINRFDTLSVVIVDYMMPELNGIDFCKRLQGNPIKKIMLTANADHSMAVKALNDGIIDCFLVKDSPNLFIELIEKIELFQKDYFHNQIDRIFGSFFQKIYMDNDGAFFNFYEKLKNELGAIEFYLLDRCGSVLFIDRDGTPTTVAVCSKKELEMFSQIAEDQEEIKVANELMACEKILFFPNKNDCMLPAAKWDKFLHSAQLIPNTEELFYALIKNPVCQPVNIRKIQSKACHEKK